jgi:hypothetical protein
MSKAHQEVIDLFKPEFLGEFAKMWLDDIVLNEDFPLESLVNMVASRGLAVAGVRVGTNGWSEVQFLGPRDAILDFGVEYLDGSLGDEMI